MVIDEMGSLYTVKPLPHPIGRMSRSLLVAWVSVVALLFAPLAGAEEPVLLAQAITDEAGADAESASPSDLEVDEDEAEYEYEEDEADLGDLDIETPAFDESQVEEIIVTGSESAAAADFATGDSVASFGSQDLEALGAKDISDLAAFTPNLEIVTSGATTPTFFIRGVGLNDFSSNSTGAVAIYTDDVPINAPPMQLPSLFDIEAVNVLRGPQGTGPGRNASAGAIKIYSRKPSGEFGGFLKADFGNYNSIDFEGAIEAPIYSDILSGRIAFRATGRDGTMRNRCGDAPAFEDRVEVPDFDGLRALGKKNTDAPWSICGEPVEQLGLGPYISDIPEGLATHVNDIGNWAARATLLFQPTIDQEWLLNFHGSGREEYAALGQSIGTQGFHCANGDYENCGYPGQSNESQILGVLGGTQGNGGYQAPEIRERLIELAPCMAGVPGRPNGTCFLSDAAGGDRQLDNEAKVQVANELAQNLDSDPWTGDFNHTGLVTNYTVGGYLKGSIELPTGWSFTTITGYDHYDRVLDRDLDFSPETLFHILTDDRGWQATQEFRLEGEAGSEGQLRWDVGAYFLGEELNVGVENDLGKNSLFAAGARDYTQNLYSVAGYVSLSYDFWDDFTLDGGFRYNWESKTLDYELTTGAIAEPFLQDLDTSWHAPTGTVRLTYRFREDTHAFWKYTRGWKPGTYNATSSLTSGVSVARPETIDSFETGLNGSWFDDRFGLTGSFFYYSYEDYQLFTAQQFAGGQPEFVILNADSVEMYGAEVDAQFKPWETGLVSVNFGWIESQFLDFVQLQQEIIVVQGTQTVVNRELQNTGNPVLNAPKYKISLTGEQTLELGRWGAFTARYDGVWTDTTYYDATEGRGIPNAQNIEFLPVDTIAQPSYWLHNMRLGYRPSNSKFELSLWVRNMTNQAYKRFAFDGSTFNNTSIYFVGDPRTFGGTLTFNF